LNKKVLRHATLWHVDNLQGEGTEVVMDRTSLCGCMNLIWTVLWVKLTQIFVVTSQCLKGYFLPCTEHDHNDY